MPRWIGIPRGGGDRDWMRSSNTSVSAIPDSAVEVAPRPTSGWARGPRPLRRREGVPTPLETPVFLHRAELGRVRARQFGLARSLVGFMGVAAAAALAIRLLLL